MWGSRALGERRRGLRSIRRAALPRRSVATDRPIFWIREGVACCSVIEQRARRMSDDRFRPFVRVPAFCVPIIERSNDERCVTNVARSTSTECRTPVPPSPTFRV